MDLLSVGIDIVELRRIRAACARHGERFLRRILTPGERARAARLGDPVPFLAGRFAAKEAILKVLGTGLAEGVSWRDIHVEREASGAPRAELSGRALERARSKGLEKILVSISHGREYAVAQAVGLGKEGEP
ncbi:MAG: holo-ACP synthase [Planctomycetota bacterium]